MQTTIAIIAAASGIAGIVMACRVRIAQRSDEKMLKALRLEADERKREEYERLNP